MNTTIKTKWGSDTISVTADWENASCQIMGDLYGGYQVADFNHNGWRALRRALEQCAMAEGMSEEDREEAVDAAMSYAEEE